MDYKNIEKRLQAAQAILQADTLDLSTFESLRTLLAGIHPRIDTSLASLGKSIKHIDLFQKGEALELTLEGLPQQTEKDKKRKKAILLFFKFWKDLKSETTRVQKEFQKDQNDTHRGHTQSTIGRILKTAKGPLGLLTLIAVGLVLLQTSAVTITLKNNSNCDVIRPITSLPIQIPGLKIPNQPIPAGSQATITLPAVQVTVDARSPNIINLIFWGKNISFKLETSDIRLVFDGTILNNTATVIDLGTSKEHTLEVFCN